MYILRSISIITNIIIENIIAFTVLTYINI